MGWPATIRVQTFGVTHSTIMCHPPADIGSQFCKIQLHCPPHQSHGGRAMKTKLSPEELTAAKNARRVFLMVAKLHQLGYEGLRICPFILASGGYWRCAIVPASMTRPDHGARLADNAAYETLPRYSSADGDCYFGWANLKPKNALGSGQEVHRPIPEVCSSGPTTPTRPMPGGLRPCWNRRPRLAWSRPSGIGHRRSTG